MNYHFPEGSFRIAPKDGTRYWHPEYDDENRLFRFPKDARPEYPEKESAKYRVGTQLNKILRHYIGQERTEANQLEHRSSVMKVDGSCWMMFWHWIISGEMGEVIDGNKRTTERDS